MPSSSSPPSPPLGGRQVQSLRVQQPVTQIEREPRVNATQKAARDAETLREATLLRNRRLKLGAGATFVIVIAATIFGAQLREVAQQWRRRRDIQNAADQQVLEASVTEEADNPAIAVPASPVLGATSASVVEARKNLIQADREILRQVALLEDRRSMLNRQKREIQTKIGRIEERQARKAEMEARRAGPDMDR